MKKMKFNMRCKKTFIFLLILIISANVLYSQWSSIDGPKGQYVSLSSITVSGAYMFATSQLNGIYLSQDGGTSWTATNTGLTELSVRYLKIDSPNIYAVTGQNAYISTNNGTSWNNTNWGFDYPKLTIVNQDIYVVSNGKIFHSTNNGNNWEKLPGLDSVYVFEIQLDSSNIYARTERIIFRSTNNGLNWFSLSGWTPAYNSSSLIANGSNLFLAAGGNIFHSTNYGVTWEIVSGILGDQITISGINIYFYSNGPFIYLSTNNGATWSLISNGLPKNCLIDSFDIVNSVIYVSCQNYGIYRSTNNGVTWEYLSKILTYSEIESITLTNNNVYAQSETEGLYLLKNNGNSWDNLNIGSPTSPLTINGSNMYVAVLSRGGSSFIYISTNNGTTWTTSSFPEGAEFFTINGSKIYAGSSYGHIFLSIDNGISWTPLNPNEKAEVRLLLFNNTKMYEGKWYGGGLYVSSNGGIDWTSLGLQNMRVTALAIKDSTIFAGTYQNGVYLSTNNGITWTSSSIGISEWSVQCFAVYGQNIFVVSSGKVYLSKDNGSLWKNRNDGLPSDISYITLNDQYIYASTNSHGVFRRSINDILTSVNEDQNKLPNSFSLSQNYPNPFNPTTTINYSVPTASHVIIKVYDLLGRQVATLVNDNNPAGNYSVKFDGSKLVSGVYFYRMEAGSFSQTKKLILMK